MHWEQCISDARLLELYDQCDFTVYPSLSEGFGLPILESLWLARPCICRDGSALAEVAMGGGCINVDTTDVSALADAILNLAENNELRKRLTNEAIQRRFKTWQEYAADVVLHLANNTFSGMQKKNLPQLLGSKEEYRQFVNLKKRPLLSICISTSSAGWLALNLQNLDRLIPANQDDVEVVVCDNTSMDDMPEVIKAYSNRSNFHFYRNSHNVGTARQSAGRSSPCKRQLYMDAWRR